MKSAKGVKIEGTAQFDPFAKELGVIANVIIETPGRKKEKRMRTEESRAIPLSISKNKFKEKENNCNRKQE